MCDPSGHRGPKDERFPQFTPAARWEACVNRLPHTPAPPVAGAIPPSPSRGRLVIVHKRQGDEDNLTSRNPDRRTSSGAAQCKQCRRAPPDPGRTRNRPGGTGHHDRRPGRQRRGRASFLRGVCPSPHFAASCRRSPHFIDIGNDPSRAPAAARCRQNYPCLELPGRRLRPSQKYHCRRKGKLSTRVLCDRSRFARAPRKRGYCRDCAHFEPARGVFDRTCLRPFAATRELRKVRC